jgi:hypothetical protein
MATDPGADQMRAIAKALKDLGDKSLKREFTKAITKTLDPLKTELAASALRTLPRRGGLAARVARTRVRVARRANGGVRLVGRSTDLRDLKRLDDPGAVRHPVFQRPGQSRRDVPWVRQQVPAGWFSGPLTEAKPELQRNMLAVASELAARIERGQS